MIKERAKRELQEELKVALTDLKSDGEKPQAKRRERTKSTSETSIKNDHFLMDVGLDAVTTVKSALLAAGYYDAALTELMMNRLRGCGFPGTDLGPLAELGEDERPRVLSRKNTET